MGYLCLRRCWVFKSTLPTTLFLTVDHYTFDLAAHERHDYWKHAFRQFPQSLSRFSACKRCSSVKYARSRGKKHSPPTITIDRVPLIIFAKKRQFKLGQSPQCFKHRPCTIAECKREICDTQFNGPPGLADCQFKCQRKPSTGGCTIECCDVSKTPVSLLYIFRGYGYAVVVREISRLT